MCGIAGIWQPGGAAEELRRAALGMGEAIAHRGPDGDGVLVDAANGVALGHRRLAIVDLTEAGRQPMVSAAGRYSISFNGEIYNFQALRRDLVALGCTFRGSGDTEVLLAAIEQWGLEKAICKTVGMFGLALWDAERRELHLVRDRLGKKPIYYLERAGQFAFASELKALHRRFDGRFEVVRSALAQYLRVQYVPAPRAIFQGV